MGANVREKLSGPILDAADVVINWSRKNSLWPLFFGLSCCFVEEATAFTSRYDIARFGAEVLRPSPRQADLLIISGTVFKKIAPVVLRLYEQMAEPKWVISMGSCSNCGGMYDVYSVVQGVDQILPVDVYIPGCPPRPEAVLQGLVLLQEKIAAEERPARSILHLGGGTQGTQKPILVDGLTKSRDPRGPGMEGTVITGDLGGAAGIPGHRSDLMWTPAPRRIELSEQDQDLARSLKERFGEAVREVPHTSDMPTFQVAENRLKEVLRFLKTEATPRFQRLDDLTAIDESARRERDVYPDFTLVYHLLSFEPASRLRLKVALQGDQPTASSITDLWPSANWYEREVFDLFGIRFEGHPNLRRLIMPHDWEGHPLRKSYPGRATEMPPYTLADARKHQPLDGGVLRADRPTVSSSSCSTSGPVMSALTVCCATLSSLDGEEITGLDLDIGYHHRGVEKIGERQTWHQFIPYCARVDYLAGAANDLPYVLAVETLADIKVPERAQVIRVLLSELFRLSNHLVWFATYAHDVGAMTPNFYAFAEREMILDIVELITGGTAASLLVSPGRRRRRPAGWLERSSGRVCQDISPASSGIREPDQEKPHFQGANRRDRAHFPAKMPWTGA